MDLRRVMAVSAVARGGGGLVLCELCLLWWLAAALFCSRSEIGDLYAISAGRGGVKLQLGADASLGVHGCLRLFSDAAACG